MRSPLHIIVWLTVLCCPALLRAQGDPLLRVYRPDEYKAGPQIWSITESETGLMYFGTGKGVLEYDGASRRLIGLPNRSGVKTLSINPQGRIYVGGQAEFGYLQHLATGQTIFQSLLHLVPEDYRHFEGVSGIFCVGSNVYFVSSSILFIYKEQEQKIIPLRSSGTFRSGFVYQNNLYVNEMTQGLMVLKGETLAPVKQGLLSAGTEIRTTVVTENNIKIFTKKNGVLSMVNKEPAICTDCKKFDIINNLGVYASITLPNGHLIFATERNGIIETDHQGNILKSIGRDEGMPSNLIWSLYFDTGGNLWIGSDEGFVFMPYQSPLSVLDERRGQKGQVLTAKVINDELYIGTTTGLFKKSITQKEANFEAVGNIHEQVWMIDTADGDILFSHVEGLWQIKDNTLNNLHPGFVWSFIPMTKGKYAVGTYNTPPVLVSSEKGTKAFTRYLSEIKESSRYIAYDSANNSLWIGHPHKGIIRLLLNASGDSSVQSKFYTTQNGLPSNTFNFVFQGKNRNIYFCTEKGLYNYNADSDKFTKDQHYDSLLGNNPIRKVYESNDGKLWYHTGEKTGYIEYNIKKELHALEGTSILCMESYDAEKMMLGTASGLYFYNLSTAQSGGKRFATQIRSIKLNKSDSLLPLLPSNNEVDLNYEMNDITFNYAATWFDHNELTSYRYKLKGYDSEWSPWTSKTEKEYTNLREGHYIFMVEARSPYGQPSPTASFAFSILSPWYRTYTAWMSYFILSMFLIFGTIRLYMRKSDRERRALAKLVKENTAEIRKQKENIEQKNKELLLLNEEKNHLLGIVAHDLRSPLNQNKGFISIIKLTGDNLTNEQKMMLNKMDQSLGNLSVMIKNILDINAIESNKINIKLKAVQLADVMDRLHERYLPAADKKNIRLVKQYSTQCAPALADTGYSEQVLENLISNAIKYSPEGKNVYLTISESDDTVRAEVKDEGPGLTEEDKQKMFGKFQRLSAKPTGDESSTGLGLSIVKKFAEVMNAEVGCISTPGAGALFFVNFKKFNSSLN